MLRTSLFPDMTHDDKIEEIRLRMQRISRQLSHLNPEIVEIVLADILDIEGCTCVCDFMPGDEELAE